MKAALLLALAACHTADLVVGDLQDVTAMRAIPNRALDVLFVVDNSPSMADKQASLAASFPQMIARLAQLDDGVPSLHVGVVTSDMGTLGAASDVPGPGIGSLGLGGCAGRGDDGALQHAGVPALSDGFVSDVADASGARVRNYDGALGDVIARLLQVGDGGCGFEQHLAAMRRALTNPVNGGFFRAEANLAVVILADEDDCSLLDPAVLGNDAALGPLASFRCFEHGVVCDPDQPRAAGDKQRCRPRADSTLIEPIAPFVDALRAAKPDPRQVMVAAIVGDPAPVRVTIDPIPSLAPSCQFAGASGDELADPAVRLAAFVAGFAGRTQLTSICNQDLGASLDAIGATAKHLVGDPCIDTAALVDTSPDPGVQPACEVTQVRDAALDGPSIMAPCADPDATECYALVADPVACPAGDHLRVRLQRAQALPDDTWIHVRCQRTE